MSNNSKPNLLFVPKDKQGCGFYRMLMPANTIKEAGLANVEVVYDISDPRPAKWANIIVMQRPTTYDMAEFIQYWRANGKKIIFEIDDFMQGMLPQNAAKPYWEHIGGMITRAMFCMNLCNAVTVSTPRLQAEYSFYNKNIFCLPNYIDKPLWEQPLKNKDFYEERRDDDIIRIGWEGCVGHRQDLELVAKVLEDIVEEYKGKVHLTLFGFTPIDIFLKLPNMHQSCSKCGHTGPLEYFPTVPLLEYPGRLREFAFDIGIAPTASISFNDGKSDLRAKEHSILGIPTVASNVPAYKDSIKSGVTGYLCNDSYKEWYKALKTLIDDTKKRKEMGKNAKVWAETNYIQDNIVKWLNVYSKVLSQIN